MKATFLASVSVVLATFLVSLLISFIGYYGGNYAGLGIAAFAASVAAVVAAIVVLIWAIPIHLLFTRAGLFQFKWYFLASLVPAIVFVFGFKPFGHYSFAALLVQAAFCGLVGAIAAFVFWYIAVFKQGKTKSLGTPVSPSSSSNAISTKEIATRDKTLESLKAARDRFWFSLGAFGLLTKEPASSMVSRYRFQIHNTDLVVSDRDSAVERPGNVGTTYQIQFNRALDRSAALGVVRSSLNFMVVNSFELAEKYARCNNLLSEIRKEDWYDFAFHLRNGIAHGGKWDFRSEKRLPATWRHLTIDNHLQNQDVDGFIGWYDALQLGAVITTFVKNSNPNGKD